MKSSYCRDIRRRSSRILRPRVTCASQKPVLPENAIPVEMGWSSGKLAYARAANSGKYLRNEGLLARAAPDSRSTRVLRSRMADTTDQFQEFKPRGDSDGANRRLAVWRSPFLPMDARLDVAPVRYIPTRDERVIRDSTRSSS